MDERISNLLEKSFSKIKASPSIVKLVNWYSQLPPRDALVVKILSALTLLALLFTWIVQPAIQGKKTAENNLANELRFHNKLKENAYLFKAGIKSTTSNGSILSQVNSLAKVKNIQLKRFEPEGNNGLRIWLEKVNFNSAIDWIETLEVEKGISIEQISIDKVKPGIVNLRAVLKK